MRRDIFPIFSFCFILFIVEHKLAARTKKIDAVLYLLDYDLAPPFFTGCVQIGAKDTRGDILGSLPNHKMLMLKCYIALQMSSRGSLNTFIHK